MVGRCRETFDSSVTSFVFDQYVENHENHEKQVLLVGHLAQRRETNTKMETHLDNLFILSNLDTHIQYSVVLLYKIPLHVSGWLAHHQEVQMCTVHAANWSSLSSMLSSRPLGMDSWSQSIPNGRDDSILKRED